MTPPARVQTAIELLDAIITAARDNGPAADTLIANAFKARRYAGSKDRAAIRDLVYRAVRAFGDRPTRGRAAMITLADDEPILAAAFDGSPYGPPPIASDEPRAPQSSIPGWLKPLISDDLGLLDRAPLDLRVNTLKATRDQALALLPEAAAIEGTNTGIRLAEPIPLANRTELHGIVEVQDAGSQMIAMACEAQPGQNILDLCAGAGGKTLALAAAMNNGGHIIACDTDRGRLRQLSPRAEAAGATNIETRLLDPGREAQALADLQEQADCVLVDAPCSGSGTWRRNPELRWRLTPARLNNVAALQAQLLSLGATLVKPGGALVYAVCSVLEREGCQQIENFMGGNAPFQIELSRQLTPAHDGTDGFYFARLRRTC